MALRTINLIVIHCSDSPDGRAVTAEEIDGWHASRGFKRSDEWMQRQNPGLRSIGYHFVIGVNGAIWTGRHLDEVGAHVQRFNQRSVGICMIGLDRFSRQQWDQLAETVRNLKKLYPTAQVVGHRDLSPDKNGNGVVEPQEWLKTCPGFDVADWIDSGMVPDAAHICE